MAPHGRNFRGVGHVWTTCPGSLLGNAAAGSRTGDTTTPPRGKGKVLDIAPLRSESPPQKRSGMARVLERFWDFATETHYSDGQTDGRTDLLERYRTMYCIACWRAMKTNSAVMLILVLVLKDSLRTKFKSLSLSLCVKSLSLSLHVQSLLTSLQIRRRCKTSRLINLTA